MAGKAGVTATVILLGSLAGATTGVVTFWGDYGWVPQDQYRKDHMGVMSEEDAEDIKELLGQLAKKVDENHTHWECDELDEEIPELELKLLEAEDNREKVQIQRELTKKQELWDELQCSKFTDID